MKKNMTIYLVCAVLIAIQFSCNKNISDRTANAPILNPTSQDLNAGGWRTLLLSRSDSFAVAAPAATNSALYLADLNEIKAYQKSLTGQQQVSIKYWSAGGALRWNEIMRGLVAKYNLPPYQNADGSYPIPSSANPFAYPLFPFSNPPYACRAYAYVSAAQYDALVACWYYKQLYNRPAPYAVDNNIQAWVTKSTLPSYPSEAAVLAGVAVEMMKLLFPDEIANIQQKAQEQELAAIMAGTATRSDITAGEALGRQVAELFITRAKSDNAGKAVGTPTIWASLDSLTRIKGEIPWLSLEVPRRPPMLPLFGKVKSLLLDSNTIASLMPGPPPLTGSDQMKQETAKEYNYIKNPSRNDFKLVQFWADGAGTYTPPGHWNAIAAEDFIQQHYSEVRWSRNLAYVNIALMDAGIVCWKTKYFYFNPRPTQMNPSIKTLTGIPNFPAYISGHSTFSGAAATVLAHLIPSKANDYMQMAQAASLSRVVAGIHYPSDCSVGLQVGQNVGNYAVQRAQSDGGE